MRKVRVAIPGGFLQDKEAEWVVVDASGCLVGGHTVTTDGVSNFHPGSPHVDWAYAPGGWVSFRDLMASAT